MKRLIVSIALLFAGTSIVNAQVIREYDRFKNETGVYFKSTQVSSKDRVSLSMGAVYVYPGTKPAQPITVTIFITSIAPDWRFSTPAHLRATAGDERFDLGETILMKRKVLSSRYGVSVREDISITCRFTDLKKLAAQNVVEFQLGNIEFTATVDLLGNLRALTQ